MSAMFGSLTCALSDVIVMFSEIPFYDCDHGFKLQA